MINKKLALLLVTLVAASCSSSKKNTDVNSVSAQKTPSKVIEQKNDDSAVAEDTMFSVSSGELKKSEGGPHVVYFATNSAKLDNAAVSTLNQNVLPEAKSSKTIKVVIEAHCDERGSNAYNQKLSEKRAKSVKSYLVKNGVKDVKIKTVGYGESKPVALGHDEDSWSKNRRAVTISIKK